MKYKVWVATRENLRRTVIDCPIALHFSGHGVENNVENLGQYSVLTKEKGNILLLEDVDGKTNYYFEDELKTLVEISKNKFEVVFVSSCHSEFAGKVFLNAGAKHVICIKQSEKISDVASLKFSSVFYETLFGKRISVCDAFRTAQKEVENEINKTEASKFRLFTQESHGESTGRNHKCSAIQNLSKGKLLDVDDEPMFDFVPSKVEMFLGREIEMYEIIKLLHNGRVVTILGPPGIGKTSISRNLANYVRDRRQFRDGIIYVKLRGCKSAQMFLTHLSLSVRSSLGGADLEKLKQEEEQSAEDIEVMQKHHSSIDDNKNVKDATLDILKNKHVLLVLDNCEDPLENDHERFVIELEKVVEYCSKLKVLLTSRKPLNALVHNEEKLYTLHPMSKEASIKLLLMKSARQITAQEIKELVT